MKNQLTKNQTSTLEQMLCQSTSVSKVLVSLGKNIRAMNSCSFNKKLKISLFISKQEIQKHFLPIL